jgi:hypothetical protein
MKTAEPIKKNKPEYHSRGHRDVRLPRRAKSAAFAGREAQNNKIAAI